MKIGILGGGQLGKMLCTPASQLDMNVHFMDKMSDGPVARVTKNYHHGDITAYDDVLRLGNDCDIVSIEIEKVNKVLKQLGKKVYPQPAVISCIQDKGLQKQFYQEHDLPSSRYALYEDLEELKRDIDKGIWTLPFVQKMRKDGYDGRGVHIIRSADDLTSAFEMSFLVEEMVEIDKELGVVTCRDERGDIAIYDPVEMIFHPDANILLYQLGPASIPSTIAEEAKAIARAVSEAFGIVGLLAIELFLTKEGTILINEVAPRPHNSGHHTIEATVCSQYENHLRAISGYPMGSTETLSHSLLMNILGDEGYTGPVNYSGIEEVLSIPGVNVHLYGKTITKPFRKMGHINIVGSSYEKLIEKYERINHALKVISK